MKPIKMLGLAALAALMAMAFAGASTAMATESTALCDTDPGTGSAEACPAGHLITHVHETTLPGKKATLLTNIVNVQCDVLFLGDVPFHVLSKEPEVREYLPLGNPLIISGNFTYTNCSSGCTVEETGGGVVIEVLKLGHETADVTGEGEVHVNCSGLNCYYNGEGLLGIGKGPLLGKIIIKEGKEEFEHPNGEVSLQEQTTKKVKGLFCPSTGKLDIVTTPLSAAHITK